MSYGCFDGEQLSTTSNLEVDASISLNYHEEEYEEEQTGVLESDEKETVAERREQRQVNAEIKRSLATPISTKGYLPSGDHL